MRNISSGHKLSPLYNFSRRWPFPLCCWLQGFWTFWHFFCSRCFHQTLLASSVHVLLDPFIFVGQVYPDKFWYVWVYFWSEYRILSPWEIKDAASSGRWAVIPYILPVSTWYFSCRKRLLISSRFSNLLIFVSNIHKLWKLFNFQPTFC